MNKDYVDSLLAGYSIIGSGVTLPITGDIGDVFFKTDTMVTYAYINGAWVEISRSVPENPGFFDCVCGELDCYHFCHKCNPEKFVV